MNVPFDSLTQASDEALLVLYGNGDREAARVLTLRLSPRVLGFAIRMLKDRAEAEDVVQEAMLKLWNIAQEWRQGEAKVSTWLYRVVSNLCTDRLRRKRGVGLDEIAEPLDDAPGAEATLQTHARLSALDAALLQLPERQRQAVILRHIEGLKNSEIAEIMNVGVEAIESLTARGKRSLAAILQGKKEELGYTDDGL
ncbi:RNA polymerase sigma factor [Cochlodiniinecator piscidefendens]|uniref:RNA polymerase sigma factor n=1 Tax=Cochlodiniinecator piscidefendens TaxID=2715756 RepID=UPI00140B6D83|nr:RNA polymerase sigma factor [Cochlodiniinecator piscidefendens]